MVDRTQRNIEAVLRAQCDGGKPFTTTQNIAKDMDVSRETVRRKINDVVSECAGIDTTTIGQAQVYYISQEVLSELITDRTFVADSLTTSGKARFYELVKSDQNEPFDLVIFWYGSGGEKLETYRPDDHEIGEAMSEVATLPLSVKASQVSDGLSEHLGSFFSKTEKSTQ